MASDKNSSGATLGLWVFVGGIAGTVIWYAAKAQAAANAQRVTRATQTATLATVPGATADQAQAAAVGTMVLSNWLRQSVQHRRVFLFQAAMYSYLQNSNLPDGIIGPITRQMILTINTASGNPTAGTAWSDNVLRRLATGLRSLVGNWDLSAAPVRVVPLNLPKDLIDQINADGLVVAADVPLLQMFSS